ncbi:MAG: tagaturonate epimerase family protein [Armatimonadota bacterium]
MFKNLPAVLERSGWHLYSKSIRSVGSDAVLFTAERNKQKVFGLAGNCELLDLSDLVAVAGNKLDAKCCVNMYALTWGNYRQLQKVLPLSPSICSAKASFGTGDRMGMVTAAQLAAHGGYPVFPIIAQQSPRELERTGRTFKSVLLDAVMGVLESGWTGAWGADADHIKDEARFTEGIDAGFSMYTLDVSDDLQSLDGLDITSRAEGLTEVSKKIIRDWAGAKLGDYTFTEEELTKSAIIYEKSMQRVVRFDGIAKGRLSAYDLEVSIDEGARDTTLEDHLFVAEYLHRVGVDFKSLAPKFPGEFQKAVDYMGDREVLEQSFRMHSELARKLQGFRLSLHSGSDKFSVYSLFADATQGNFHIKTSGTSWLQAITLIAHENPILFAELYAICLAALPESKKAYHVYITPEHFPAHPTQDLPKFYANPDVQQLFHISYGALLDAKRDEIVQTLAANETRHYGFVTNHIDRHLGLLFGEKG